MDYLTSWFCLDCVATGLVAWGMLQLGISPGTFITNLLPLNITNLYYFLDVTIASFLSKIATSYIYNK